MSNLFEERERGYEAKWAHDEEVHFKIMSLRNERLAQWAAELMKLPSGQPAQYAQAIIGLGMSGKGSEAAFVRIRDDLAARNVMCPDETIRQKMKDFYMIAEQEQTKRQTLG